MTKPAPTVTLTIAGKPVEIKFSLLTLVAIEERMGKGLTTIMNELRVAGGIPDAKGEPAEDGGRATMTEADVQVAIANARIGPRLKFLAALTGKTIEELADAIEPHELTSAFLAAFMGLLVATSMLVPQDPEKAEEGTHEVPTSAASAPGPA